MEFPSDVGPHERYNVIYRDVYELVELYDDVQRKYFNNIEFQQSTTQEYLILSFMLSSYHASTVQNFQSILPEFSTSFLHQTIQ